MSNPPVERNTADIIPLFEHLKAISPRLLRDVVNMSSSSEAISLLYQTSLPAENLPNPKIIQCLDWRHFVFDETCYFPQQRLPARYKAAAFAYKSVFTVGKVLQKIFHDKKEFFDLYSSYWFPQQEVEYIELKGATNGLHTISEPLLVISVNDDKIYDFIDQFQTIPSVKLTSIKDTTKNMSLFNVLPFPIFLCAHNLRLGKVIKTDKDANLQCVILNSQRCPCGKWLSWVQPTYTFPMISQLWRLSLGICPPINHNKLAYLLSLMFNEKCTKDPQSKLILSKIVAELGLHSDFYKYNSGLQILNDMWPASEIKLIAAEETKFKSKLQKSLWTMIPTSDMSFKKEFEMFSLSDDNQHRFAIFKPLNYSIYPNDYMIFSNKSMAQTKKKIAQTIFRALKDQKNPFIGLETAIIWDLDDSKLPIPTLNALIIFAKLKYLQDMEHCTVSWDNIIYSRSKFVLFAHLFILYSRLESFQQIWMDIIEKDYAKPHLGLERLCFKSPNIKTLPIVASLGLVVPDDLLQLDINEKDKLYEKITAGSYAFVIWKFNKHDKNLMNQTLDFILIKTMQI